MKFNSIYKILLVGQFFLVNSLFPDDDGLSKYKEKDFEAAKNYYEQLLSQKDNSVASLGLGASQYQLGDFPNATKSFQAALNTKNSDIQNRAYFNIGNTLYNQQKMQESVAFYRKALETNPNDEDAKFNYELAKYITEQQQEQQQNKQQDQQEEQDKNDPNQNNQNQNDEQENDQQKSDKSESDQQEDERSDSNEQEQREPPKSQKQMNAEAILDALKDDEKIHQKIKMAKQSTRKYEKDW